MTLTVPIHWSPYTGHRGWLSCFAGRVFAGSVRRHHDGEFRWEGKIGVKASGVERDIEAAKRAVEEHVKQFLSL